MGISNDGTECWRFFPCCDGYMVSNSGRVFSFKRRKGCPGGRFLKPIKTRNGYFIVTMGEPILVHRAVFISFYGDIPSGFQINHKNGIKADNTLKNLELMTHRQNLDHYWNPIQEKIKMTRKLRIRDRRVVRT